MIYSFEQIKKTALRAGNRKKGKKLGYSEYLYYDKEHEQVICYRLKYKTGGENIVDVRKNFDAHGYSPESAYVLAVITPEQVKMDRAFTTMSFDVILKYFGILCQKVADRRFELAFHVRASDNHSVVTPFPVDYEYGVGFTNTTPPRMLDFDPEKRKALNKLIREKRHMLKTRAKLGATFTMTPELTAKHIVKGMGYREKEKTGYTSATVLLAHSPYLASFFSSNKNPGGAKQLLELLKAAEPESLDSLSAVVGFQQIGMLFFNNLQLQHIEHVKNPESVLTSLFNDPGTSISKTLETYNNVPPMTKYQRFEQKLANAKGSLRQVYGADFYEKATQSQAKEALDIPL